MLLLLLLLLLLLIIIIIVRVPPLHILHIQKPSKVPPIKRFVLPARGNVCVFRSLSTDSNGPAHPQSPLQDHWQDVASAVVARIFNCSTSFHKKC